MKNHRIICFRFIEKAFNLPVHSMTEAEFSTNVQAHQVLVTSSESLNCRTSLFLK